MPGEIDIIKNVLELEKKKNFNNTAVAGGLKNFKNFLDKITDKSLRSSDILNKMSEVFIMYDKLDLASREQAINELLNSIYQIEYPFQLRLACGPSDKKIRKAI